MDHRKSKQQSFSFANIKAAHRFCHGGVLYQKRAGRGQRPLSTKEPLHLVFKVRKEKLRSGSLRTPQNFQSIQNIIQRYAKKFFVKIEQLSIQGDHIHALIRTTKRSLYHHFFRVVAGQIAQQFQKEGMLSGRTVIGTSSTAAKAAATRKINPPQVSEKNTTATNSNKNANPKPKGTKLWKYRPYTRVIRGHKAYDVARNYVQLNEKEAQGKIVYRKERLKGLSAGEWEILWS